MIKKKSPDVNSTLAVNLKKLMARHSLSLSELHRATGLPITTLARLLSTEGNNPRLSSVIPLANFFSISIAELIGLAPLNFEGIDKHSREVYQQVPIINWSEIPLWLSGTLSPSITETYLTTELAVDSSAFALCIENDNYEGFFQGAVIIVDPKRKPKNNDFVVTMREGQKTASLKEYLEDDGMIYLRPLKRHIPAILLPENTQIIGVIVQLKFNSK